MIILRKDFKATIETLASQGREYGLDSETTGLRWEDSLFMLILHTDGITYLFNFHSYLGEDVERCLPREWLKDFSQIFARLDNTYFISNAKFDMRMLAKEGLELCGRVICTNAGGRVLCNNHLDYSLAASAERVGYKKDESVERYITKNKLYSWQNIPGKKKRFQLRRYQDVPFPLMATYAATDAFLHATVGKDIVDRMPESCQSLFENEIALTKVCFAMEQRGVKLDVEYTKEAQAYEEQRIRDSKTDFAKITGQDFYDSNVYLAKLFKARGIEPVRTDKGNPSFTDEALSKLTDPAANAIRTIRYHEKRVGSFYSSFLFFAGKDGIIHPNMRQGGTETGRFSYSDPNLQQVSKEENDIEDGSFLVRRCFAPRDQYKFVAVDYKQQEYRVMLDYAGETNLIRQVLEGEDVHQATATLCGITRREAKTVNFAILYGAGSEKLAAQLGISKDAAQNLKNLYFRRLPKVQAFIRQVIEKGRTRGHIFNWAGRRCYISDPNFAYVLPNHLIQGSGADVMKFAMVRIHEFLKPYKTRMVLSVHDELVFEEHESESGITEEARKIMESIYPAKNGMILETDVKQSAISWASRDLK